MMGTDRRAAQLAPALQAGPAAESQTADETRMTTSEGQIEVAEPQDAGGGTPDPLALPRRAGRALIGWMSEEEGAVTLAGRSRDGAERRELTERVAVARRAVAAREGGVDQSHLLEDVPSRLEGYLAELRADPSAAPYVNEGWEVKIADLARVCALQQTVVSTDALARVREVDSKDLVSLARLTLPRPTKTHLPAQFDEGRSHWILTAANPNLKLTGHFGGELQPGVIGFGFIVSVMPSFVQVARHHGRYVLRDGYHRAFGLLAQGITKAPAFVRDFGVAPLGLGQGLFGTDVYLGERPPLLGDFLDDEVSAEVSLPAVQKMLVIQGLELTPIGS